jgi:hypothetical protein
VQAVHQRGAVGQAGKRIAGGELHDARLRLVAAGDLLLELAHALAQLELVGDAARQHRERLARNVAPRRRGRESITHSVPTTSPPGITSGMPA